MEDVSVKRRGTAKWAAGMDRMQTGSVWIK